MLKRLTLSPEANGENGDGADNSAEQSELRLRRSLEMLSGGAKRDTSLRESGQRDSGHRDPTHRDTGHRDTGHRDSGHRDNSDHIGKSSNYSPAGARRHRFKDDGEVPVVHVAPHRDRAPGGALSLPTGRLGQFADGQAAEERASRERAERALEAARETIRHLQTRVGHDELALREATEQAVSRDRSILVLRQELEEQRAAASAAREAAQHAEDARASAEADAAAEIERYRSARDALLAEIDALRRERIQSPARAPRALATPKIAKPRRVAAAVVAPEDEPEPVKWWLPAAKATAPGRRAKK